MPTSEKSPSTRKVPVNEGSKIKSLRMRVTCRPGRVSVRCCPGFCIAHRRRWGRSQCEKHWLNRLIAAAHKWTRLSQGTTADGFAAAHFASAKRPRYKLLAASLLARTVDDTFAHTVSYGTGCRHRHMTSSISRLCCIAIRWLHLEAFATVGEQCPAPYKSCEIKPPRGSKRVTEF